MCPIVKIYNGFAARGCSEVTAVEYGKIIWCNLNSVLELWIVIKVTNADTLFINIPRLYLDSNGKIFYSALDGWITHFISVTRAQVGVLYRTVLFLTPLYNKKFISKSFLISWYINSDVWTINVSKSLSHKTILF